MSLNYDDFLDAIEISTAVHVGDIQFYCGLPDENDPDAERIEMDINEAGKRLIRSVWGEVTLADILRRWDSI